MDPSHTGDEIMALNTDCTCEANYDSYRFQGLIAADEPCIECEPGKHHTWACQQDDYHALLDACSFEVECDDADAAYAACQEHGHVWEVTGASAESGRESFDCGRCGESMSVFHG